VLKYQWRCSSIAVPPVPDAGRPQRKYGFNLTMVTKLRVFSKQCDNPIYLMMSSYCRDHAEVSSQGCSPQVQRPTKLIGGKYADVVKEIEKTDRFFK
jgi:hypothetical protein